jgi:predicted nuclease of restriction endonuclease-like (RecB) superfamily
MYFSCVVILLRNSLKQLKMNMINQTEYTNWLKNLKESVKNAQIKASISVNKELIVLYFHLGIEILEKQKNTTWGNNFIGQLSKDLQTEFPYLTGFSKRNLEIIRQWVSFYSADFLNAKQVVSQSNNLENEITTQLVSRLPLIHSQLFFSIPWGHHILIIQKIKEINQACFYIEKTVENNWSRSVLEYQIETKLYERQGKAINNFNTTLPQVQSDLAHALLKDPYHFEFITMSEKAKEKDLELKLVQHISQFLLELGKGFAYMGQQYLLKIGNKENRTDLLFYHTKLKCYIIIELKYKEFEPEFIGKLNFYISAINELLKDNSDQPTIGILLCKNKDQYEVEFALKDINKPIGVSEYRYTELPDNIKQGLPTVEQLTDELKNIALENDY